MRKIVTISGSLRKGSYNTKILEATSKLFNGVAEVEMLDISEFPLFNADLESTMPESVLNFKKKIEMAEGIIISTPEYNRSISGVLKNAIDWASRPKNSNSFDGKPVLTMGVSNGRLSTAVAQSHLKQILVYLNCDLVGQPELYIGNIKDIYNEATGEFAQDTLDLIKKGVDKLLEKIK